MFILYAANIDQMKVLSNNTYTYNLFFSIWPANNTLDTDLNDGTGLAWAGQDMAKDLAWPLIKLEMELSAENLGEDPPMGSREGFIIKKWTKQGLKTEWTPHPSLLIENWIQTYSNWYEDLQLSYAKVQSLNNPYFLHT